MCDEILISKILISSTGPIVGAMIALASAYMGSWMVNKHRKMQNSHQYAKDILPILLEILEDIEKLKSAFIFQGRFCPEIEHRGPGLNKEKDGDGILTMSYAQRGYQFRSIGSQIIRNCRRMVLLTPKQYLPDVLLVCSQLKDFLCERKNDDQKMKLDSMIICLMHVLEGNRDRDSEIDKFVERLSWFCTKLEKMAQKEVSVLVEKK